VSRPAPANRGPRRLQLQRFERRSDGGVGLNELLGRKVAEAAAAGAPAPQRPAEVPVAAESRSRRAPPWRPRETAGQARTHGWRLPREDRARGDAEAADLADAPMLAAQNCRSGESGCDARRRLIGEAKATQLLLAA
jgi:hypothetical protein